jgi:hypothetical protein
MDTDDVADSILAQEPANPTRSAEAARRAEAQEAGGGQEEQKAEDEELREGKEQDEVDGEKEPSPETEKPERFIGTAVAKKFKDGRWYRGLIEQVLPPEPDDQDQSTWWRILFDDGDVLDVDNELELLGLIAAGAQGRGKAATRRKGGRGGRLQAKGSAE